MILFSMLLDSNNVKILPAFAQTGENLVDGSRSFEIAGDVASYIERLKEELIKALRSLDPHHPDYVHRLRDEQVLYNLICLAEQYAAKIDDVPTLARARLLRIEAIYYQHFLPIKPRRPVMDLPSARESEEYVQPEPETKDVVSRGGSLGAGK